MSEDRAGRFDWERIIRRCRIDSTTKLIALLLASYANRDGSNAHPGIARLAATSGVSDRTVKRHLAALEDLELIRRSSHGGGRNRLASNYELVIPADLFDLVEMLDPDERTGAIQMAPVARETKAKAVASVDDENYWNSGHPVHELGPSETELRPPDVRTEATAMAPHHVDQPSTTTDNHAAARPPAPLECRSCNNPLRSPASLATGECSSCRSAA